MAAEASESELSDFHTQMGRLIRMSAMARSDLTFYVSVANATCLEDIRAGDIVDKNSISTPVKGTTACYSANYRLGFPPNLAVFRIMANVF